eukprot:CAMPEP_0119079138 /NCGR_PEP_ID=MMETSP1178-20130426/105140_1 /TAXON_ID=33656 /ORGANISM="unid sp, Strain CCMP2000" /LENGTH=162 /DNA_ID=CAMNT_0007061637 /DNA_START=12 /DNA_END=497 /DNA_ORIENTATION=+
MVKSIDPSTEPSTPSMSSTREAAAPLLASEAVASVEPVAPAVGIRVVPMTMARSWEEMVAPPGLLLRERVSLAQLLCSACEKRISFAVGAHPAAEVGRDFDPIRHLDDEVFKASLDTRALYELREDSSCLCRYCCHQNRELRLGLFPARANAPGSYLDVELQ